MDTFADALSWVGSVCLALPGSYQEPAWVGVRWKVRANTFAHLLEIVEGYPPSFAAAAGTRGPTTVLTFRSAGHELGLILAEPTSFGPLWNRGDVGIRIEEYADRGQLAEWLVDSYRLRAPKRLVRQLDG
ncbi:MAG: MmcQ/YjbR family DNA-binding protein [Jatrophihabitantaceae bacterium]